MRILEILSEQKNKVAVFTFGRMNPPTKGHEKLIKTVRNVALSSNGKHFIFTSQTHDNKRNPLTYERKIDFLKQFFPDSNIVEDKNIKTVFDALEYLEDEGYNIVYMVSGEDRINEFREMITPYIQKNNPNLDPDKALNFDKFEVINAGYRDPDTEGIEGISGTKARELAKEGKEQDFIKYVAPSSDNIMLKKSLYDETRKGLGILG